MKRSLLALAALAAVGFAAPASAAPVSAAKQAVALQMDFVDLAQYRPGDPRYRPPGPAVRRGPPPRRYAPGARLRNAPPGYRRHGARPGNWRTRGCVMVGPIWFCP